MFAYEGVRAMFLGLKFHLKAIFFGLKFANMNFPFFFGGGGGGGGEFSAGTIFSQLNYVIPQKLFLAIKLITKMKLLPISLGRGYAESQYFWVQNL